MLFQLLIHYMAIRDQNRTNRFKYIKCRFMLAHTQLVNPGSKQNKQVQIYKMLLYLLTLYRAIRYQNRTNTFKYIKCCNTCSHSTGQFQIKTTNRFKYIKYSFILAHTLKGNSRSKQNKQVQIYKMLLYLLTLYRAIPDQNRTNSFKYKKCRSTCSHSTGQFRIRTEQIGSNI